MADNLLNPYAAELMDLTQQQKLAQALTQQGMQQPQGQMVSGHYVRPSITQALNPLAQVLTGAYLGNKAEEKGQELAAALRGKQQEAVNQYANAKTVQEKFISKRNFAFKGYLFFICIALFIFLVFVKLTYGKEFTEVFLVLKNIGLSQQLFREMSGSISVPVMLINFFSLCVISLYIFLVQQFFKIQMPFSNWETLGIIALLVAAFFIFRNSLIFFLSGMPDRKWN